MKKLLIVVAIIMGVFLTVTLVVFCKEYGEVNAIDKTPLDISKVENGVYEGTCETTLVQVKVRVTVKDGTMENIEILEHQCGKGMPANAITRDMVNKNEIEVDAVSGATVSSEVIKSAVRNALR